MFVTKLLYTAGHAEINAYGDIDLCIPIWNTSRVYELGTYQAKHGMMSQTHYAFPIEPNRAMKVGVSVYAVRSHHTIEIVVSSSRFINKLRCAVLMLCLLSLCRCFETLITELCALCPFQAKIFISL